jgi:hypothetical protein
MWLEIHDQKQATKSKIWSIDTEPIRDYQIRVCVYDTEDIPNLDDEGTSDVYITGYIDRHNK